MKIRPYLLPIILGFATPLLTSCTTGSRKETNPAAVATVGSSKNDGKSVNTRNDDLDEYEVASIADPLEPLNRGIFWFNHQLYTYLLRPISKTYEKVLPKPVRKGVANVFDNVEYPVRFVNDALQGNFPRAGQETGKFVVNTVLGVGGIIRMSDKFPALADVPEGETGLTFAKWGIGHGAYLVLPMIGPSSVRDGVGLVGDYALNPITWLGILYGSWAWTIPVSVTDTIYIMPDKFVLYDATIKDALDRYLAVRSAYVQYREEAAKK